MTKASQRAGSGDSPGLSVGYLINSQYYLTKKHFLIWSIKWHAKCYYMNSRTWNWGIEGPLTKKTFTGMGEHSEMLWPPHQVSNMNPFWAPSVGLDVGCLTLGSPLGVSIDIQRGWGYDFVSDLELFLPFLHNLDMTQRNGHSSPAPFPLQVSSSPPGISWTPGDLTFPAPSPHG